MVKAFIDGQAGPTGLGIRQRLLQHPAVELLETDPQLRKDDAARKAMFQAADIAFLCLPDQAAREAAALAADCRVRLLDASTAHRTADGWVYGFPELLAGQRQRIKFAKRVANPGCHATGFLSIVAPLVAMDILPKDYPVTSCVFASFYIGSDLSATFWQGVALVVLGSLVCWTSVRKTKPVERKGEPLNLHHKHLPEMQALSGLKYPPVFSPIVDDYYKGMATGIQLHNALLKGKPTAQDICELLGRYYEDQTMVRVAPWGSESGMLAANTFSGYDNLEISVTGTGEQTLIVSRFDNLGKGASGAAVQNMNLMLGLDETTGLAVK